MQEQELIFPYLVRGCLTPFNQKLDPCHFLIELTEDRYDANCSSEGLAALVGQHANDLIAVTRSKFRQDPECLTTREINLLSIVNDGGYRLSYEIVPHA